jgi:mRNA-degrading endonuclease toxin of MazEF toxin-antitoxin module
VADGIARGDVCLYEFAPPDKKRPVVVLTRNSAIGYLSTVTVAPITSTIRGVPSEAVNLHNSVSPRFRPSTHAVASACSASKARWDRKA